MNRNYLLVPETLTFDAGEEKQSLDMKADLLRRALNDAYPYRFRCIILSDESVVVIHVSIPSSDTTKRKPDCSFGPREINANAMMRISHFVCGFTAEMVQIGWQEDAKEDCVPDEIIRDAMTRALEGVDGDDDVKPTVWGM